VADCLAWSGRRPVEWLVDHAPVDRRWCLIHATHITDAETSSIAASGAIAGLCPVTEANLGDGTFPAPAFAALGGRFGIGTDSNVRIGVTDELRQLEYAQRLHRRARNVMAAGERSTGRSLFDAAYGSGQQALGIPAHGIAIGAAADLVSLATPLWEGGDGDGILDAWIFASGVAVDCVWVGGKRVVEGGRHMLRDEIASRFRATMRELLATS
jgi:formiminoglutamate deiminase